MSLAGVQLLAREIADLAHLHGWNDQNLIRAVAVCSAESGRWTEAVGTNPDGSHDYGLFQINSVHLGQTLAGSPVTIERLFVADENVAIAHALWKTTGWDAWAAYTSGRYLDQVAGALNGIRNYWRIQYGLPVAGVT